MKITGRVAKQKLWIALIAAFLAVDATAESNHIFEIKLKKPEFILPQYSPLFSSREAAIALEEVERAVALNLKTAVHPTH